jgi:hypothetical protein
MRDVTPCDSFKNRHFGGTYPLHHRAEKNKRACNKLVTANIPSSSILYTLLMNAILFLETSVLTRATWHPIPEDGINHENRMFKCHLY